MPKTTSNTYSKADIEGLLGDDPIGAIQELIGAAGEYAAAPKEAGPIAQQGAAWAHFSNRRLKGERSQSSKGEKLRRAYLGLLEYNEISNPYECIFPDSQVLSTLADLSQLDAMAWLKRESVASEVKGYKDELEQRLVKWTDAHKAYMAVLDTNAPDFRDTGVLLNSRERLQQHPQKRISWYSKTA